MTESWETIDVSGNNATWRYTNDTVESAGFGGLAYLPVVGWSLLRATLTVAGPVTGTPYPYLWTEILVNGGLEGILAINAGETDYDLTFGTPAHFDAGLAVSIETTFDSGFTPPLVVDLFITNDAPLGVDVLSTVATIDHDLIIGVGPDQHHDVIHALQNHTGGFLYKTGVSPTISDTDFVTPANGMVAVTYDTSANITLLWTRTNAVWDAVEANL